jgi:hypothetical protein
MAIGHEAADRCYVVGLLYSCDDWVATADPYRRKPQLAELG